ncbi:MAG TPA: cobalamin biosynthesis protein [Mycobacteriales bacterium]|jgi:adenosylcobinamide-phosphate synthase|nr:cobalamin biosynthesis protein [Mycobacteriales bacterium]
MITAEGRQMRVRRRAGGARAAALGLAVAADLVFADPRRWHPVAGFGQAAGRVEKRLWRDSRAAGIAYVAVCVGLPVAGATALTKAVPGRSLNAVLLAAGTWAALGGTSLTREGDRMAGLLRVEDLSGARDRLGYLCGRDPAGLDAPELARATVESLAENTSDAVVAPLFWAAVAGLPGVIGYRAVNTLDAMVGYRSPRYQHFGWAAARFDDAANLIPARFTAGMACLLAPVVGGSPRRAWRVLRRDGGHHPSPNAGRCEAAFAGALDRRLGGRNVYAGAVEDRGTLGDGAGPSTQDIARTARLSRAVGLAAAAILAACVGRRR